MSYHHLSSEERYVIYHLRLIKLSFREIGRRLGRHHTTISREVRRTRPAGAGHVYVDAAGQQRYRRLKQRRQHHRRRGHKPLWRAVLKGLQQRWSPEQIAGRLKLDHPKTAAMRVSPQTIYNWVYEDAAQGGALYEQLRRRHKKPRKQRPFGAKAGPIRDRVSIHQRPAAVARRARFGDWEGDSVMGARGKGALITLAERKSRFTLAARLEGKKAGPTAEATNRLFKTLPAAWRQTLTLDNGSEFADFKTIERQSGLAVYFADPYAAYQRGLNEHTNGLIRQYFPKATDFLQVSDQELASALKAINNRPRKCLGFRTPQEVRKNTSGAASIGI